MEILTHFQDCLQLTTMTKTLHQGSIHISYISAVAGSQTERNTLSGENALNLWFWQCRNRKQLALPES